ncbi:MAG: hypothetical protein JO002_09140 [Burkholderiaceae bacterium]|nr:hypothetical protein [Burkholderiaceae bacterium]
MLDLVQASVFAPFVGKTFNLQLEDGSMLPVLLDTLSEKAQYRNPYAPESTRTPFAVYLTAQQATAFLEGLCHIELGEVRLEGVHVSRVAALGRDPNNAYYQIIFN